MSVIHFTDHWPADNVGIITVEGELDASNSAAFADHVDECATAGAHLVIDLSPLRFFGTAGFSALHTINVRCANSSARWAMVTGEAVSRLMRVCDPDHTLPVAGSVAEAVEFLDGEPRQLLELVAEPG
ncbi:anti-anti-sigma factor [Mycolicibacterium sp. BK556]|uniref:STAS domain-containing protein n=1 Tax=Mycobacteriaceae TaxID=1762 RepID=UPI00105B2A23|nr:MULTISPECIES: STAS domain-containing protein [Mycobacteriaceae]MBB3602459.1 anti-anti-sigma factor [Mycolicibacterium sp. BK556]MBB3632211.1 anti-anti-sigma factor [Mycolicibacterium sp. BK607]MBB3750232.1 anti-anti-sigma factor [Mycolicibacterium sp. BK634]TDO18499.1 anti-anti-sigma factor [Mycobacterium sp. BK086]